MRYCTCCMVHAIFSLGEGYDNDGLHANGDSLSWAEGSTCPQWAQPVQRDVRFYRALMCAGSSTSVGSSSGLTLW
jgi:hypothetical protein